MLGNTLIAGLALSFGGRVLADEGYTYAIQVTQMQCDFTNWAEFLSVTNTGTGSTSPYANTIESVAVAPGPAVDLSAVANVTQSVVVTVNADQYLDNPENLPTVIVVATSPSGQIIQAPADWLATTTPSSAQYASTFSASLTFTDWHETGTWTVVADAMFGDGPVATAPSASLAVSGAGDVDTTLPTCSHLSMTAAYVTEQLPVLYLMMEGGETGGMAQLSVDFTCTDDNSGVATIDIQAELNGKSFGILTDPSGITDTHILVDPAYITEGEYLITMTVTDLAGNSMSYSGSDIEAFGPSRISVTSAYVLEANTPTCENLQITPANLAVSDNSSIDANIQVSCADDTGLLDEGVVVSVLGRDYTLTPDSEGASLWYTTVTIHQFDLLSGANEVPIVVKATDIYGNAVTYWSGDDSTDECGTDGGNPAPSTGGDTDRSGFNSASVVAGNPILPLLAGLVAFYRLF